MPFLRKTTYFIGYSLINNCTVFGVQVSTIDKLCLSINGALSNFGETNGVKFIGKISHNNVTEAQYQLSSGGFSFTINENGVTVNQI